MLFFLPVSLFSYHRWRCCYSGGIVTYSLELIKRDDEQLEAHLAHTQEYVGSCPAPAILLSVLYKQTSVAWLIVNSPNILLMGNSSVWLERLIWDQEIVGSNPTYPTIFPEWKKFITKEGYCLL